MSSYTVIQNTALANLVGVVTGVRKEGINFIKTKFPDVMRDVEEILSTLQREGANDASGYDVSGTLNRFNLAVKEITGNLNIFFGSPDIDIVVIRGFGDTSVRKMIVGTYGVDPSRFDARLDEIKKGAGIDPKSNQPLDIAARAYMVIVNPKNTNISITEYNRSIAAAK